MDTLKLDGNTVYIDEKPYVLPFEVDENRYVSTRQLKKYDGADVIVREKETLMHLPTDLTDKWFDLRPMLRKMDGYIITIQKKSLPPLTVIVISEADYLIRILGII